jgi:hypothetical protein
MLHFTRRHIKQLMDLVAAVALALAIIKSDLAVVIVVLGGSPYGAWRARSRGGSGMVAAGIIGGVLSFWTFGAAMYARMYFFAEHQAVDYLGPVPTFLLLMFFGSLFGAGMGGIVWAIRWAFLPLME